MPIVEMVYLQMYFTGLNSSKGDHLTYMHYFGYQVAYESPTHCYTIIQLSMLILNNHGNFHIHK